MIPSRPIPRVPSFTSEVLTFRDKANAINGSPAVTMETLSALDRFVRNCYNAGVWDKLTEIYPFVGSTIVAAATKLKWSVSEYMTFNNYIFGDYNERGSSGGLLGNGSTKYVDTNFSCASIPAASHLSVYLREDLSTTAYLCGAADVGLNQIAGIAHNSGVSSVSLLGGTTAATQAVAPMSKGFWHVERASATSLTHYKDNASVGTNAANTTPSYPAVNIYLHARNFQGTGAANFANKRISFASVGLPMSAAERTAFAAAVLALQTELTRNI